MAAQFVLLVNGALQTFTSFDDLPGTFQNVIVFQPELTIIPGSPEEPNTLEYVEAEQAERQLWIGRLQTLIANEIGG